MCGWVAGDRRPSDRLVPFGLLSRSAQVEGEPCQTINYRNTNGKWPGFARSDHCAVRWTSRLRIRRAGNYHFSIVSDDGSKLWINNRQPPASVPPLLPSGSHADSAVACPNHPFPCAAIYCCYRVPVRKFRNILRATPFAAGPFFGQCGCPKLPFGRSSHSIFVPWGTFFAPWRHPGDPWEQQ